MEDDHHGTIAPLNLSLIMEEGDAGLAVNQVQPNPEVISMSVDGSYSQSFGEVDEPEDGEEPTIMYQNESALLVKDVGTQKNDDEVIGVMIENTILRNEKLFVQDNTIPSEKYDLLGVGEGE